MRFILKYAGSELVAVIDTKPSPELLAKVAVETDDCSDCIPDIVRLAQTFEPTTRGRRFGFVSDDAVVDYYAVWFPEAHTSINGHTFVTWWRHS